MIRKSIFLLTLAVAMCFASCEKYDHAIADIEDRLDKIEGTSIKTIEQQIANINTSINDLKSVDVALQTLIDDLEAEAANLQAELDANAEADAATKKALEDKITALETLIATLQEKDTELDKKIADLETFVNDEITATEDWANATFATLKQYEDVQTEIAAIKALVEQYTTDITTEYTKAIEDAITASETSMKEWVNGVLAEGYYAKAEIDGKITALQTLFAEGDAVLQKEIDDLKATLAKAESDLTAAYKKAIEDAINENSGTISAEIADAVKAAQDKLQAQIDAIDEKIETINQRLTALENNFANRIQSLTYIPTHTDGKATMTYNATSGKWEAELSYFVTPKSIVGNIERKHISAKGVYTASTRAVNLINLSVTAFESDATNGTITVTILGDNLTNFLSGTSDAAVFLIISDGNSEFVSDYVPLALKNLGNIDAANMIANDLKTAVSQALNNGIRDFTINGNLTQEHQKAVGMALSDWCGIKDGISYNAEGHGTVSLTLPDVTEIFYGTFGEIILDGENGITQKSYALKSVNMPNVTIIGEDAFNHQYYLQNVTAPKVVEVKRSGFGSCSELVQVDMPNVIKVGNSSFDYTSLTDFPFENLKEIDHYAFQFCDGLTSVNLSNATSIGDGAFRHCSNLESITAPKLTVIPLWAFSDCKKLTALSLGSPVTEWKNQVLNNMQAENITLYLHKDQKALSDDDSNGVWTIASGAATVDFGTNKTFCGYTFKEIKKYGE